MTPPVLSAAIGVSGILMVLLALFMLGGFVYLIFAPDILDSHEGEEEEEKEASSTR